MASLKSIEDKLDNMAADIVVVKVKQAETSTLLSSYCKNTDEKIIDLKKRSDKNDLISSVIAAIPGIGAVYLALQKQ
jgi:IMP cyclohydrolase